MNIVCHVVSSVSVGSADFHAGLEKQGVMSIDECIDFGIAEKVKNVVISGKHFPKKCEGFRAED